METKILSQEQKQFYRTNGFLHIKSVFSPEEVQTFRRAALLESQPDDKQKFAQKNPEGVISAIDLLSHDVFKNFIIKKEVISILKELLEDDPLYFGVSCVSINYFKNTIHRHRDNINFNDPNGDDWKENFSITRIGIYLEDHIDDGGNIWFNPESHKNFRSGKRAQSFDYKAGDLVVWSLLTEHSVSALPRKLLGGRQIPTLAEVLYFRLINPLLTRPLPTSAYPKEKKPRIFMTAIFAGKSDKVNTERMINRRNHREWNWKYKIFNNTKAYEVDTFTKANQRGLTLNLKHILDKSNPYEIVK